MAQTRGPRVKKGLLERLDSGDVVVGDGSFLLTLEKRGYMKAGLWTPEAVVEHPNAGASVVGVNCRFGPWTSLKTMSLMKEALQAAGLKAHLMVQSLGFHMPDCGKGGFLDLPEYPFALEPRVATRWDVQKYAREAYNLGVRYIGGCCGFEPYHIRAIAEELAPERGFLPPASEKHGSWGSGLNTHTKPWIRARNRNTLEPAHRRACVPQQQKTLQREACILESSLRSWQSEKSPRSSEDPEQPKG